ncbi:MAG: hypothetical protein EWV75_16905 [Microcystis wesenbergii Mw_QC_S_20081001_S30D]|uniref:Uncharacterized protein n=1 Tax=Microcystis wesenbergii Mw_QC_S_20081001_S30D TaxID=2486245 RepID=A0A552JE66_9CHRO|nr:MAG: hypothetical protein EWV75_16905 [Microcystis wesenbergii Mw_QC_S_20081001_S30D]TRU96867.1 MAG: hypothetical protein EWV74_18515 [Microcystis wesenbergii Mw_QC_S_20081001_S30]TRV04593.1 MAG: hypothetical protein EWV73_02600 [Microcystis wesenbergii Mw_QC_B_20070930_S4D]TRV11952.1 MAG: hypothetical protein EWV89_14205 [Microcystis wesenbergii Mw_QC_B_20070930_S4]
MITCAKSDCQISPKIIRLSEIKQNIVNSRNNRQKSRSHDINCKGLLLTVLAQQSAIFQDPCNRN